MKKKLSLFLLLVIVFGFGYRTGFKQARDSIKPTSQYQPLTASFPVSSLPSAQVKKSSNAKPQEIEYVANRKTKKFHKPSCSSVKQMNESNKLYFTCSRSEMISKGYDPCGRCNP